jgi:transposase
MTKADRIRALYAEGLSTSEIAEIVGCGTPYVRVCARQRKNGGYSEIDRRYAASDLGRLTRRRREERWEMEARKAYYAALESTADLELANAAAREARRAAIERGASDYEVHLISRRVRSRIRSHTGCKAKAREAAQKVRLQMRTFHVNKEEVHNGQQA